MPLIDSLADRVWFAYHCLPKDGGALPSYRSLEIAYGLSFATFSKTILGARTNHMRDTIPKMAEALRVSSAWLNEGTGRGPTLPPGVLVPPRPGNGWKRHGDVPGWDDAVAEALERRPQIVPPEAFRAGADLPVYRLVTTMTPELATWVAGYAWETATPGQQKRYSMEDARAASPGHVPRSRALRRPAVK